MLEPIIEKKEKRFDELAEVWNQNFTRYMKKRGYTERQFAAEYRRKFGSCTQSDVNKWRHIGGYKDNKGTKRRFPDYITMKNIAEVLGVDLAFLTGEVSDESYEKKQVCRYLNISEAAAVGIKTITRKRLYSLSPEGATYYTQYTEALNCLLSSKDLDSFIACMCEYATALHGRVEPSNRMDEVAKLLGKRTTKKAIECLDYCCDEDFADGPEPTPELLEAIRLLSAAQDDDYGNSLAVEESEREIKIAKYSLLEAYQAVIDGLMTPENIQSIKFKTRKEENDEFEKRFLE